jgi:pimeloyl-ACP methyl ester carboxylesterase
LLPGPHTGNAGWAAIEYGRLAAVRFMLVHSPLVGPATWQWVAEALRSSGHDVAVSDLREAAISGAPRAVVRAALQLTAEVPTILVGHSGAGFFLPSIAAGFNSPVRRLVFVDAGVPPCEGEATTSEPYRRDADTARSLGWPVMEDLGNHLDIVNEPESLARDLVGLAL